MKPSQFGGLKGRIPVEQLDDEQLTNIERRIVAGAADAASHAAPMRAPRFGLVFAFGFAAIIAIGAGFAGWQLRGGGSTPGVAKVEPVRVNTTADNATRLDIGDARIVSDPATEFVVTRPDGGVLVTMARGKVELSVGKRGDRAPLVVAAGDTKVIVVGTQFSVDYGDGSGPVDVRVTEGAVKVERHQQTVRVAAGEAWTTKTGVVAIASLPANDKVAIAKDGAGANDGSKDGSSDGATIDTPEDRDADRIEIDTNGPDSKIPTTGVQTGPTKAQSQSPTNRSGSAARSTRDTRTDLQSELQNLKYVLSPLDLNLSTVESVQAYTREAARAKAEEAAMLIYSIAAVQHLRHKKDKEALAMLDWYMRRFANIEYTTVHNAARWLRVRILCKQIVNDRCRQAAFAYVHQADDTPARKLAEAVTREPR